MALGGAMLPGDNPPQNQGLQPQQQQRRASRDGANEAIKIDTAKI
jgi:hypothetical protein